MKKKIERKYLQVNTNNIYYTGIVKVSNLNSNNEGDQSIIFDRYWKFKMINRILCDRYMSCMAYIAIYELSFYEQNNLIFDLA